MHVLALRRQHTDALWGLAYLHSGEPIIFGPQIDQDPAVPEIAYVCLQ
jgi:hypothetical protein